MFPVFLRSCNPTSAASWCDVLGRRARDKAETALSLLLVIQPWLCSPWVAPGELDDTLESLLMHNSRNIAVLVEFIHGRLSGLHDGASWSAHGQV